MKVLVTGSSGFVGRQLLLHLIDSGYQVVAATRSGQESRAEEAAGCVSVYIPDIDARTDWHAALDGVEVVIHCAAIAHGKTGDSRAVNVDGAIQLARQCVSAGVRRLVFLSSIGVNGSSARVAFTEADVPNPGTEYAMEKLMAEKELFSIAAESDLEVVAIRPPLVYGKDAPGNFGLLCKIVSMGVPLPLAGVNNSRSFISVLNLVAFIELCVRHPAAGGHVFLVSDGESVSTSKLLTEVAAALGVPSRLFWVPRGWLLLVCKLIGRSQLAEQLFCDLEVNDSLARQLLGWSPPYSMSVALEKCWTRT